jgi:hypothetical protein
MRTRRTLSLGSEFTAALKACEEVGEVSGASNSAARESAVKDALEFLHGLSNRNRQSLRGDAPKPSLGSSDLKRQAQEIFESLNFR